MPLRSDWSASTCPVARTLDVVGDPWVLLILRESMLGARRYEQFAKRLTIAPNILSRRLSAMVEAGLLVREPYQGSQRTHDAYVLTEAGADLFPVLNALGRWGNKHTEAPVDGGTIEIRHLACGSATDSSDVCTSCGAALTAQETAWVRPWLAAEPRPLAGASSS